MGLLEGRPGPFTLLRAAREHAAPSLARRVPWRACASFVERLPACVASLGFECRLDDPEHDLDWGAGLDLRGGGAEQVEASGDTSGCPPSLRSLARRWLAPGSSLRRRVPFIFLELDAAGGERISRPSVFAALDWTPQELETGFGGAGAEVSEIAELLGAAPLARAVADRLERSLAALPPGGLPLHVAVMLGRPACPLRLSVLVPRFGLAPYLAAIGELDGEALLGWLGRTASTGGLAHRGALVQLDFQVGATEIGPGIAFSLCPTLPDAWSPLLEQLAELGLCRQEFVDALATWPGATLGVTRTAGRPWALLRRLDHVKVTCSPGAIARAKAYFSVAALPAPDPSR